jgi:DNA-binding NarL/FixJ family response regulator
MTTGDLRPTRVLLGNLEPLVRLGMHEVLEEQEGVEVVGHESRPRALVRLAGRLRPDAVVLDLRQLVSRELGERVRDVSPQTKVILWTRDEDEMEVLDPGASVPRRFFAAVPDELALELGAGHGKRVEE